MDLYQQKYLKYKQKYITLKQSLYGGTELSLDDSTGIFSDNVIIFKQNNNYLLHCYVIKGVKVAAKSVREALIYHGDSSYLKEQTILKAHFYYSKNLFTGHPTTEEAAKFDNLKDKKIKCFISQQGRQLSLQYNELGTTTTLLTGFKLYSDTNDEEAKKYYGQIPYHVDYLTNSKITIVSGAVKKIRERAEQLVDDYDDILKKAEAAEKAKKAAEAAAVKAVEASKKAEEAAAKKAKEAAEAAAKKAKEIAAEVTRRKEEEEKKENDRLFYERQRNFMEDRKKAAAAAEAKLKSVK